MILGVAPEVQEAHHPGPRSPLSPPGPSGPFPLGSWALRATSWQVWFLASLQVPRPKIVTLDPSRLGFRPGNQTPHYIMPRAAASCTSFLRRQRRADLILRIGHFAMRACSFCTSRNALCIISPGAEHCEQCTRANRRCELAAPTAEMERLADKDEKLSKEVLELEAKALRLRRERRRVRQKMRVLGAREEQNILDLEADEAAADVAVPPVSRDSPGEPISPTGLSQVSFGSFGRTSPVPVGNQ